MTTQELEAVKKELADISAFVRERVAPLAGERARLKEAVADIAEAEKRVRRRALLAPGSGNRPVVEAGPYEGFDALDLAVARSLCRTAQLYGMGSDVAEWGLHIKAAMDSLTAEAGDELVPAGAATQLWRDVNLETMVASLFSRINMPTTPFDIPLQLGDVNWYPGTENVSAKSTALTTAKQTLTAYELVAEVPWSLTLEEDAVIAMLPEVRRTLVRNAAEVIDDVLLNGDTTATNNINADGATIATTTPGKAHWLIGFDGLLHLPLVDNTGQANNLNGAVTAAAYNTLLKMLGKYGVRNNEAVFITDVNTFLTSLSIEEVETVDKLGPHATILTGQLGVVYGHPLIVSEQMRLADTDGKVTDAGNGTDTGRILAANRTQWRVGFRR
ncbi:MAG: phage major capsid protein, partial [Gemmatimonadetes bacterium]|nr:phage major capsid protein [Gemmatimonadota bacterium]